MSTNSAQISRTSGILLLLFAISTLISQSLMDLFSTMLCLYLAYNWVLAKKQKIPLTVTPKMNFDWLWAIWFIVTAIGFVLNRPPPTDAPEGFWLARLVEFKWIFILYFMVGTLRLGAFREKGIHWFNLFILICSAYALIDYGVQVNNATTEYEARLGGLFQFAMTYAHTYGIFLCALLGFFFETHKRLSRVQFWFFTITLVILGTSVLFTFTRGAWIAAFIAVISVATLKSIKNGIVTLLFCATFGFALYLTVPSIKNRIDFTAKVTEAKTAKDSYDTERIVLWKTNLMIFEDHPWFGTGYGQNKFQLHEYYAKQGLPKDQFIGHAHNQYLHLLAGTGIFGILCYVGMLLTIFVMTFAAYIKSPKDNLLFRALTLGSLGGQIFFAIGGLTEANFEHSKVRFAIMFMWAFGIWIYQEYRLKNEET